MSSAASVVPSSQPPLSQVERVVDTFVAPSKTFRDINRSASWWMPLLLIILVSYGFIYVVEKKVGFEKVTENTMRLSPKQMDQIDSLLLRQPHSVLRGGEESRLREGDGKHHAAVAEADGPD